MLACIYEVWILEEHEFLHIGPLHKFAEQNQEFPLLIGREARPVRPERLLAHRVGVQEFAEQDGQRSQLFIVRLIARDDSARLL